MENKFKLVSEKLAPRPSRRSYARSVYDAIHASRGEASMREIAELIPSTDDADKWQAINSRRLVEILDSTVSQGYICRSSNNRYRIAPLHYYSARQEIKKEGRITSARKRGSVSEPEVVRYAEDRRRSIVEYMVASALAFAFGCCAAAAVIAIGLSL